MDSLGIYGRQPIGRWSIPTQCSTFMFHVKPGVDRSHWPIQHVSARSTARAPFSHSLSHRVPLRDRVARQKRGSASGLPSVAMRRAARLLRGDAGEGGVRRRTTRIGSHRQHRAMPPVGSTQRHMVCTLPPTTDYQYRVPLFHVKPAAGCGLIRFLRRRASASWQERGPVPTETVAPMRVRPASV